MHHLAEDLSHKRLHRIGSALHLLVAHLHNLALNAQVGNDADAKGANATVVSHNHLGHS